VADREDGGDVAAGELMLLPLVALAQILVPVRPGDDLVPAVAVQIGDGESLFRLVSLAHVGGDHLDAGPGIEARVLAQRRPAGCSAALVPDRKGAAPVALDIADQFIMKLVVSGFGDDSPLPVSPLWPRIFPPAEFVGAPVAAVDEVGQAVPGQIVGQPAAL